jgi:lipopolysaccharide export LptBFGC system permease protein LptF
MILQRYILRELVGSFAFAFCTVLAVCLVGTMFQVFRSFPGVGFEVLSKAMPLATGAMASWVMLVASCTSSTLVYARLSAENEITAMRTCGIHLWSIASPAVLLGILLVAAAYPLNEYVVPWTRHNRRLVFRDSIVFALRQPPAGQQDFRIGSTRIVYTDYVDGKMVKPTISQFKDGALIKQVFAPAGQIVVKDDQPEIIIQVILTKPRVWQTTEYVIVHLLNGQKIEGRINDKKTEIEIEPKNGKKITVPWSQVDRIQKPPVMEFSAENDLTLEVPTEDLDKLKRQPVDQPSDWIWEHIVSAKDAKVRNFLLLVIHTRYAASLAPMLLVLVAMPIGILVSRGSRLAGLGAALPPLLIYFISYFIFQGLGARNRVPPIMAAYLPDLFLGAIALVLLSVSVRR